VLVGCVTVVVGNVGGDAVGTPSVATGAGLVGGGEPGCAFAPASKPGSVAASGTAGAGLAGGAGTAAGVAVTPVSMLLPAVTQAMTASMNMMSATPIHRARVLLAALPP
jgi:hypothetical protein